MTKMKRGDWYSTSHDTNIAESAHVISQKDGIRLTLVSAIQVAKRLDMRSLDGQRIAQNMAVFSRQGNQSVAGKAAKNIKRQKKTAEKRAKKKTMKIDVGQDAGENILVKAARLLDEGLSLEVVDFFLKKEREKIDGGS